MRARSHPDTAPMAGRHQAKLSSDTTDLVGAVKGRSGFGCKTGKVDAAGGYGFGSE